MSLKGKEALHMYQIGIDIGGTNVKIGLLDEALELTAETSVPFAHDGGGSGEKDPRGSPCAAGREERGALRRRLARRGRPRQHRRERRDGS